MRIVSQPICTKYDTSVDECFAAVDALFSIRLKAHTDTKRIALVYAEDRRWYEMSPAVFASANSLTTKALFNDLIFNMRKIEPNVTVAAMRDFFHNWLSCYDIAAPASLREVMVSQDGITYRFTHFPRLLPIIETINRGCK